MYPYIHSPCEYFDTNPTKKCLRFIPATSQKRGNCEESCLGEISKANTNLLIPLERPALGTPFPSKMDEFSEKFQRGGGVIFNPKIYIADFCHYRRYFGHEFQEKFAI